MTYRRFAARAISGALALRTARQRDGLRILMYHSVGSRVANNFYGLSIAADAFERQMTMLKECTGLTIVTADPSQIRQPGFRVAVTFDDGYRDNLHVAAPILTKLKIPFTVFVTVSYLQSRSEDYLTTKDLQELAHVPGAQIGSHGLTHVRLAECDEVTLLRELNESRRALEDKIGKSVMTISYPHGSVDSRVREAARSVGYELGGTSRYGINKMGQDPLRLHRCEIVSRDTERVFMQKLRGHWDWKARWQSWPQASDF